MMRGSYSHDAEKGCSEIIRDEDWRARFFREMHNDLQHRKSSENDTSGSEFSEGKEPASNVQNSGRISIWDTRLPSPAVQQAGSEHGESNSQMVNDPTSGKTSIWDTVLPVPKS
jgi:hypothetical protein